MPIKQQYADEVALLIGPPETTIKTATAANPISFTFNNCTLYTEQGSIDIAVAWTVSALTDATSTSVAGTGVAVTATSTDPLLLTLSDGDGNTLNFSLVSGSYSGDALAPNTSVEVGGGE